MKKHPTFVEKVGTSQAGRSLLLYIAKETGWICFEETEDCLSIISKGKCSLFNTNWLCINTTNKEEGDFIIYAGIVNVKCLTLMN